MTLNLFEEDVEFFQERFGYGWSQEVRRIMHREVTVYKCRDNVEQDDDNDHGKGWGGQGA